ncbi:MAG: SRPBCC domain-containing protein [Nostocales cyanobacterium W4_Combined_metabat2_030]|nr:SRPBCC domain-containing protein [Nostocales cyanobacterium W4_Combined_metabat2_030]
MSGGFSIHQDYQTKEGIVGRIKVFKPLSHIRLTWQKHDWQNISTLQIRIIATKSGTTISFHQEKLLDANQRAEMKMHWESILMKLTGEIE